MQGKKNVVRQVLLLVVGIRPWDSKAYESQNSVIVKL